MYSVFSFVGLQRMRTAGLLIVIASVLLYAQSVIEQVDRLFSYGEDAARDRQAFALIERAVTSETKDYQLLWRAARACFYAGEEAQGKDRKISFYDRGIELGERAVAVDPNRAEGRFWLGANYGGASEQKGAFNAVRTIGKIRAEMEAVVRIQPGYEDARAFQALCELDRQLPRLLGGNNARAIRYCEQGLERAPRNLELKLALARAYLEAKRRDEARQQLQEIVAMKVNPARARAERGAQEEARRLLAGL